METPQSSEPCILELELESMFLVTDHESVVLVFVQGEALSGESKIFPFVQTTFTLPSNISVLCGQEYSTCSPCLTGNRDSFTTIFNPGSTVSTVLQSAEIERFNSAVRGEIRVTHKD